MINPGNPDEIADQIISLWQKESNRRSIFEGHWEEIAKRMYAIASDHFQNQQFSYTKGEKKNEYVYDSTASVALGRFAAILDSLLTPRNQTWHRLVANQEDLNKNREVKLYYEAVNKTLFKYRYAPKANFAGQNQLYYKSLGAFGSAAMYIDELFGESGIRYKNCHLGEVYFIENHQGMVDKVLRRFPMTARNANLKWKGKIPDKIKSAMAQDEGKEFFFIHYVGPRYDLDPSRVDFKGMPYVSYYVSVEGKEVLEEGGYGVFPYAISRYDQAPNEVYGRSPAMEVLPAVKSLNEMKKTMLKQGHRAVDPVLLVHDDGILDTFSLKPGHANAGAVNKDGRPLVHTLPVGSIAAGKELMDDERSDIKDAFLVNLFQILIDNPQMTATEVMERSREKGMLLAPTIGRQESERLGPQIERELDLLSMQGLLPPMPGILQEAGAEFKIEYDSPLSRTQRAEEASGVMRTIETALNYANVSGDPAPLDHFDMDVIVPELADINAVPSRWRRSLEDIARLREGRAQAQQTEQAIQAGPSVAAVMKAQKGQQ